MSTNYLWSHLGNRISSLRVGKSQQKKDGNGSRARVLIFFAGFKQFRFRGFFTWHRHRLVPGSGSRRVLTVLELHCSTGSTSSPPPSRARSGTATGRSPGQSRKVADAAPIDWAVRAGPKLPSFAAEPCGILLGDFGTRPYKNWLSKVTSRV